MNEIKFSFFIKYQKKISNAVEVFRGSYRAKQLLEKMVDYSNVPRKKPKFMNFMRNSFRGFGVNDSMLNEIWSVIENIDKQQQPTATTNNNNQQQNGNNNNGTKRKSVVEEEEKVESKKLKETTNGDDGDSFNWFDAMKSVLSQKENGLTLKKLEKKVI